LPLGVPCAEVFREDFTAAARDPVDTRVAKPRGRVRVRQSGTVGEEHELCDRERVELDAVAVALAHGGEQVAVEVERELRVEAAVERNEVAAELNQLVDLREDLVA